MSGGLAKRLQLLASVLSVLVVLALLAAGLGWWRIRASLPPLDGDRPLAGLGGPVKIERDALGVPTITGATRLDVARATGYVHAQDRFFQMDLLRRSGAGELAELFGAAAVPLDHSHRLHGFRARAAGILPQLPPEQRDLLATYTAGVNAGLADLSRTPWEYAMLRIDPQPWREEDCLLVIYAMWLDLQTTNGSAELSRRALRESLGAAVVNFLAPTGTSWDSALDGSTFAPPPLPEGSIRPIGGKSDSAVAIEPSPKPGSNSFILSGAHTTSGVPLLANDMHLDHRVPQTWYRAVLAWTDSYGTTRRLIGVTLPGMPILVAGSNGQVAWGFTNAYTDTADVVVVDAETTAQAYYRSPDGFKEITARTETIRVKGSEPVMMRVRQTEWGPIIGSDEDGRPLAFRWVAHESDGLNLELACMETVASTEGAIEIAHRSRLPNQNIVIADSAGRIAWTLLGRQPRRVGFDGRFPVSWAYGDRRWEGWLNAAELPLVTDPQDGLLWTANQRLVGGESLARLGDGGYDNGARGAQIRDGLRALVASGKKAESSDLLGIQLDDRARFLERWQQLLLATLTAQAVEARAVRGDLHQAVVAWGGRASPDSAAFRLVHAWRHEVARLAFAPFFAEARNRYPAFEAKGFQFEDALWLLAKEQPVHLLNPSFDSWKALLLQAADRVLADAERDGVGPEKWQWGNYNRLRMRHPFSHFLPAWLRRGLDLPADPLPGATEMPRVQTPHHGASQRMVVSPGREDEGIFHMPGGQSGNPLSPFYRAGHDAWVKGAPTPLLPGPVKHTLTLSPP